MAFRGLTKKVWPKNIRVKALYPRMIATTFHDTFTKDQIRKKITPSTPLLCESLADEIANTLVSLASSITTLVTSANIDINDKLAFS